MEEEPQDPKAELVDFLKRDVQPFLAFAVENYSAFAPSHLRDLGPVLEEAVGELENSFEVAEGLIDELPDSALEIHGLTGAQLRLKRRLIKRGLGRMYEKIRGFPGGARRRIARWIRWGAKVIDDLLETIGAIVPPAIAISEVKKVVESVADATQLPES